VLTKNVIVMLFIVLTEAALGWNFAFWSYFVVIFRVEVDVLYRRANRTSIMLNRGHQSFRCPLIYHIKWDNWLLRCLFLTKKGKQFFYKLLAFRR
jgi:hypothetical protein